MTYPECTKFTKELNHLKAIHMMLYREYQYRTEQLDAAKLEIATLKEQLGAVQKLNNNYSEIRRELNDIELRNDLLVQQIDLFIESGNRADDQVDELLEKNRDLLQKLDNAERRCKAAQQSIDTLTGDLTRANHWIDHLTEVLDCLREQLEPTVHK